ncbi:type I-E CRISPR-associated protein Cse2/CasB [Microbulbifer thermotolerans]|uniref:type I-E CRISPR-associated protein Cse2/CasB n=1 Tax=Microbulbifer thermotolerans TaxID=252514 RepID=UPI00224A6DFA|nr:type I-E CRISPR-associated protein Cse2/CasB [Microbulbifer thermotolerans]MCX2842583.1 type I-E CRISPR-associated protein Cse2/CasB [Microbulbifer thermotolerans]
MSETPYYQKLKDENVRVVVLHWWEKLQGINPHERNKKQGNQRGARAELRRCYSLDAVLLTEAFRNLWMALAQTGRRRDRDILAWACVAAALAEVRGQPDDKTVTFAKCLGAQKEKSGKPFMSELRFARLQKSRDGDDFLTRLRRALALINKKAPVLSLADDILHWFYEHEGHQSARPMDRLAVRWATDYFTALSAYSK